MEQKRNQGYVLSDSITIGESTFVLGYNPKAPSPYVTWVAGYNDGYYYGHYFTSEEDARKDLFKRAISEIPEETKNNLVKSLISQELRAELNSEERNNIALADIECSLYDALDHFNIDEDKASELMKDESFMAKAMHLYDNIDHSAENEALTDNLENLIEEQYPNLLPDSPQPIPLNDRVADALTRSNLNPQERGKDIGRE